MDSQIVGPSDSLSLPSEPPEIRNWFPSYQYESPKLDSYDIFGGSICEETEFGIEEDLINGCEREKEETVRGLKESEKSDKGEQESISQNIDSSYSPSLPSEPVHVTNWFSNYVYESPALDTSDGFRDSPYKESERDDGFDVEGQNREIVEDYADFRRNGIGNNVDGLGDYGSSLVDNKQEKVSLNKANPRIGDESKMCFKSGLEHCSDHALFQNHGVSTAKGDAESNPDQDGSQSTLDFCSEVDVMLLSAQRCSKKSKRRTEIIDDPEVRGGKVVGFSSPEYSTKSVLIDAESAKVSARGCNDKENVGNKISSDGFVTTRKGGYSRENEENCVETPKGTSKRTDYLAGREDFVINRKAFAERTNFQDSSVTEITGKWKCPQKRKPNLGPPLKQLRLERWVQRF